MQLSVLKFIKTRDVESPTRAHSGDAGIDFYVPRDFKSVVLQHGDSVLIPAGIKVDVPKGWALIFMNKSGVASKKNLDVMACVVDSGYQGEVHINLINSGIAPTTISPGEKIVQAILFQVGDQMPIEVDESQMWLSTKTGRGEGGFGSTN